MIRVGFIGAVSKEWIGAVYYFKNLLYAISALEEKKIEAVVFIGKKADNEIKELLKQYAIVVENSIFDRKSFSWFCWKITQRIFKTHYFLEKVLKKYQIEVLSHTDITNLKSCKIINWIPDFQHLHLPHMFSEAELKYRNKHFFKLVQESDAIILSSFDALKDFHSFAPLYVQKTNVLQFVSQPDKKYFELNEVNEETFRHKYNIFTPFFYLPNQFWKHKNHLLVFEAVKILKEKGLDIAIICTGYLNDYRNSEHIHALTEFITIHHLADQIKLLGLVDYEDVFTLIKFSKAVINPSLFEGWSSTVEECKSVGKNMILSDLNVHKEQSESSVFFDKNSAESLADVLIHYHSTELMNKDSNDLQFRTLRFGSDYQNIVMKIIGDIKESEKF